MHGKRRLFLREAVSTAELYVLYTQKQRRITDASTFYRARHQNRQPAKTHEKIPVLKSALSIIDRKIFTPS
jgi:hypothetical protein